MTYEIGKLRSNKVKSPALMRNYFYLKLTNKRYYLNEEKIYKRRKYNEVDVSMS